MNRPLIWAHRGASGVMPENTLLSFAEAVRQRADGLELDVQMSRDGHLVVIHDESIDRTSSGTGFVRDMTLAELKSFDYSNTHPECGHAEIPLMSEVFELIAPTDLTINIELKNGVITYEGLEEKILAMTAEYGMENRVIYSSFNHHSVAALKKLSPSSRCAFLHEDGIIRVSSYAKNYGMSAVHPSFACLRYPGYMEEAQEEGLDVNVWTVNTEEQVRRCIDAGVHAVITNYPAFARKIIEEK